MAVVTISRKVGSFGDEIGALVAEKLGYKLVNREDFHALATSCDLDFKKACSLFEEEKAPGFLERSFFREPAYASLFASLVYELAAEGNLVLLGRGGQVVLRGEPGVFNARVVAPTEVRVKRIAQRDNISEAQAAEFVHRFDKERRSMIESLFDIKLSDWSLYDLVINTAAVNQQTAADMIARGVQNMTGDVDNAALRKRLGDLSFALKVESAIKKKVLTAPFRDIIVVNAGDGALTLSGVTSDRRAKTQAEEIARSYPGVTSVSNELKTTELSF